MHPEAMGRIARLHRIRNTHYIMGAGTPLPQFVITDRPLLVGPVLAEFGHELFIAAMARRRAHWYKKCIVSTLPERQALYADFATDFRPHDIRVECAVISPIRPVPLDRIRAVGMFEGDPLRICEYNAYTRNLVEFIVYGREKPEYAGIVAVHARCRNHVLARNWPVAAWEKVVTFLREQGIERIVSIGTVKDACHVPGTEDMRTLDLAELMNLLRSARFAVGPSSGPMHLASLCKCPHVVWCGGGPTERHAVVGRYQHLWNPHQTPVIAVPYASWRPAPDKVIAWVAQALKGEFQVAPAEEMVA